MLVIESGILEAICSFFWKRKRLRLFALNHDVLSPWTLEGEVAQTRDKTMDGNMFLVSSGAALSINQITVSEFGIRTMAVTASWYSNTTSTTG
jgi:hypothetical protein